MRYNIFDYLKQFFRYPTRTGAIAPSCSELGDLITDQAGLEQAYTVIEFGSGTGVFTEKILQKISNDATFFALEINPEFAEATSRRCPDAIVYNDGAENTKFHLERHGKQNCDCIISGLPWAVFNPTLQDTLLNTVYDVLKPGGRFLTMAYLYGLPLPAAQRFKAKLYNMFPKVIRTNTVWANWPPAFIYCAEK